MCLMVGSGAYIVAAMSSIHSIIYQTIVLGGGGVAVIRYNISLQLMMPEIFATISHHSKNVQLHSFSCCVCIIDILYAYT